MNIEKPLYMRLINGEIIKSDIKKEVYDIWKGPELKSNGVQIKSASHNIIDLIEVGDLVNGREVVEIEINDGNVFLKDAMFALKNSEIETILTHEQIEQHSLKVGE